MTNIRQFPKFSDDYAAELEEREAAMRRYIEQELITRFKAMPEYQAMKAESDAENDRIINGTGEIGPGITPELRAMLGRPGIIATAPRPRPLIYSRIPANPLQSPMPLPDGPGATEPV